jgi:hypothetical protein
MKKQDTLNYLYQKKMVEQTIVDLSYIVTKVEACN